MKEAYVKNPSFKQNPILPKPDIIYEKNYHFMNESLLEKQLRKEKKLQQKSDDLLKEQTEQADEDAMSGGDTYKKPQNIVLSDHE